MSELNMDDKPLQYKDSQLETDTEQLILTDFMLEGEPSHVEIEKQPSVVIHLMLEDEIKRYRHEIVTVIRYIHGNFNERVTLHQLSREVLLNESYLSRLFKSETGRTINHYLNEVRIYHAAQLLCNETLMIKEIAKQVGIKDQLYFDRVFKKFYNMTPTEYRKLQAAS